MMRQRGVVKATFQASLVTPVHPAKFSTELFYLLVTFFLFVILFSRPKNLLVGQNKEEIYVLTVQHLLPTGHSTHTLRTSNCLYDYYFFLFDILTVFFFCFFFTFFFKLFFIRPHMARGGWGE